MTDKELSIVLRELACSQPTPLCEKWTDDIENYTYKDARWYSLKNFDGEQWRRIDGYGNVYSVSNYGRVKTDEKVRASGRCGFMKYRERILKCAIRQGYLGVTLCYEGKTKTFLVSRLVAMAFIPNKENKPEIDHINTIRADNRVCNLRWVTKKENANNPLSLKHKKDNYVPPMKGKFGRNNPESIPIIGISVTDGTRIYFDSISDAHREGFNLSHVAKCVKGERRSHKGYVWKCQTDTQVVDNQYKLF